MLKVSTHLGKVNDYLSMKFSITIRNEKDVKESRQLITENAFEFQGKDYLKYNLYPVVSLEIQSDTDKHEVFNASNICQLNSKDIFAFTTKGKKLLSQFYKVKNLFVYRGKELVLNKEIADKIQEVVVTKYANILLRPIVVTEAKTNEQYEGICMMFRQYANYVMMTIDEFTYLVHKLDKMDLDMFALLLYNTAMTTKKISETTPGTQYLPGNNQTQWRR